MKMMIKSLLAAVACVLFVAASPLKNGYEVGDTVADFKLKNVNGKMVSLSDYASAKGVIVIFDCNTCPYSRKYNSRIIALNKKFAPQGFPVVTIQPNDPTISPGDSFAEMIKQAERKKYDFPYLFDETQNVARTFGATNTPQAFVLKNTNGKFTVAYIGAIDDVPQDEDSVSKKYIEEVVQAILFNKEAPYTRIKVLGCTIKWKNS